MIVSKSEKLQFVGAKCIQSLALENSHYQSLILKENGVEQIIRLLKLERPSDRVILATVEAIASLCVDIAHVNNENAQIELCDRGAIKHLLDLIDRKSLELTSLPPSKNMNQFIVIEAAYALACLILHREKIEIVERRLNLRLIVDMIETENLVKYLTTRFN